MSDERAIRFLWTPEVPRLSADSPVRLHVLIAAEAPKAETDRAPLNIALVLDRSGSMRGVKLRYTLESARMLVERLAPQDLLSVVFYDTEVETVLKPTPARDRAALLRVLEDVRPRGTTNLSGGWLQGLRLLGKSRARGSVNRLLLMTDGLANRGVTEPAALEEIAAKGRRKGIVTTTLGFGKGFNEDLLTAVARAAGGNFHFIENPDDAPKAFGDELGDAMGLAAQNLQAEIRPAPGVKIAEILNPYLTRMSGDAFEIFPGDVFAGEQRTLLLLLDVQGGPEGHRPLFEARFEFDDLLAGGEPRTVTLTAALPAVPGPPPGTAERSETVAVAAALQRCARVKADARARADRGDLKGAVAKLEEALRGLDGLPDRPEVERERKDLRRFAVDFRRSGWDAADRKNLSASIFRTQIGRMSASPEKGRGIADTRVEGAADKGPDPAP